MEICSLKWNIPFSCIISGPSQSGKTEIIKNIIKSNEILFSEHFDVIFYFYKTYQETYNEILKNKLKIFYLNSIVSSDKSLLNLIENYKNQNILFVFDDLQSEIEENNTFFTKIWTIYIHHFKISCIAILHNLFTKNLRTISLNTHKVILTQNLRDTTQIRILSQQAFPRKKNLLSNIFNNISNNPYPYIILDFAPSSGNSYIRILTNIFTHEHPIVAFKESDCGPYEKLIIISQDYYKCLISNGMCNENIENKSSAVNNINLNNKISNNGTKSDNEGEELYSTRYQQNESISNTKADFHNSSFKNENDEEKGKNSQISDKYDKSIIGITSKSKSNLKKLKILILLMKIKKENMMMW